MKSGSLDLNAFLASRSFEIKALQSAMRKVNEAHSQRAFQTLPRNLRRRAASHNVKLVPKILRGKATLELKSSLNKVKKRKITSKQRLRMQTSRRARRVARRDQKRPSEGGEAEVEVMPDLQPRIVKRCKYRKRQLVKTWLPTHLYHTKRAHMMTHWGFALPMTPRDKSFRPTYRSSSIRGFVCFDMSYLSTFMIRAADLSVLQAFISEYIESDCVALANRYINSARKQSAVFYNKAKCPQECIGPVDLLWLINLPTGKPTLLLRCHSAIAQLVYNALVVQIKLRPDTDRLVVEDWRFAVGHIDIIGPEGDIALRNLFANVSDTEGAGSVWKSTQSHITPNILPTGVVLPLLISDPRLNIVAQKINRQFIPSDTASVYSHIATWSPQSIKSWPIYSKDARRNSLSHLKSVPLGAVHKHLSGAQTLENAGTPILPIQLEALSENGWRIMLPWDWVSSVWHFLMKHSMSRFGGITERRQISYQNSLPTFPNDWLGTTAGLQQNNFKRNNETKKVLTLPLSKKKLRKRPFVTYDAYFKEWCNLFQPAEQFEEGERSPSFNISQKLSQKILACKTEHEAKDILPTDHFSKAALIVEITYSRRGSSVPGSAVYAVPPEDKTYWEQQAKQCNGSQPTALGDQPLLAEKYLLGYVTTGNFSLSLGHGFAIANLALYRVFAHSLNGLSHAPRCIVVNPGGQVGRVCHWKVTCQS